MTSNRLVALIAAVLMGGLAVGVVAGGPLFGNLGGTHSTGVSASDPPMSVTTASGCASPHQRDASGWLMESNARNGRGRTFVFNQTYAGDWGANVHLRSSAKSRAYTLVVSTDGEPDTRKQGTPPADCWPATSVQASVTLPGDYARFSVVRDGETVVQVNNSNETTTRVWKLNYGNATR